jgi:A/G-specific adenine glycosylase
MAQFFEKICNWYASNARKLPWRETTDPYRIWVSEIILQQTRVEQGLGYYTRFIKRFPDLISLANADEDEVLRYWQGLGYYSRARNLHEAAKSMNGKFPSIYNKVLELKGVGKYTAAAICSIAYGMAYAVVDGNVYRVLSRYFGIETPIDSTKGKKEFEELAQSLLPDKEPGLYNQALMDFGAIQCTPATPKCDTCPLADACMAKSTHKIDILPIKSKKIKVGERFFNYFLITDNNVFWQHKRTGKDIWMNLFELPLIETEQQTDIEQLLTNTDFKHLTSTITVPLNIKFLNKTKYLLTHRIIHANFYQIEVQNDCRLTSDYFPISLSDWKKYAMPQLIYRFLEKTIK